MKLFSFSQLAVTTLLASGVVLGALMPSEACMFSKNKGTEVSSFNPFKSGLNDLNPKQLGLMGAGVLFLGGVAAAGVMSHRSLSQPSSDEWETSSFSIPVPPDVLESSVEVEKEEELTSVH
jgi:hypothetical protein